MKIKAISVVVIIICFFVLNQLVAQTLTIQGNQFYLDNKNIPLWGIRVASASQSESNTSQLISALDDYKRHGVNSLSVFIQGSSGGYSNPFTNHGKSITDDHFSRLTRIIEECQKRSMVVIVGIFYQRTMNDTITSLPDENSVFQTAETITTKLKPYRNVIINIANEQNSSIYRKYKPFNFNDPQNIINLCRHIKRVDPSRIVGGGGYNDSLNIIIGKSEYVDVLLFDTFSEDIKENHHSGWHYDYFRKMGVPDKPFINVEIFGAWTAQFSPPGVYTDEGKRIHTQEIDEAFKRPGLQVHFHSNLWIQGPSAGQATRFDLGGAGTLEDPGIRWWFEHLKKGIAQGRDNYFTIKVIDQETGLGVPLVELKTTNNLSYYTDNNGIIAFYEPGLMNQKVFFHVQSHGYEYPKDGFGYRGVPLLTIPGTSAEVKIRRTNIAERLYRITGEGLYNNSLLVGYPVPLKQPLLNGKVMGQDTFIETLYKEKMYWIWGDTDRPSYPLGNFASSGATSELPGKGGLDPAIGVDLTYFVDSSGFSKKMCPVTGPGPVWIHWLAALTDSSGHERLVASYTRIKTLSEIYERGLAMFNDSKEVFEPYLQIDKNSPFFPDGQSLRVSVDGQEYIYFATSSRNPMRIRADLNQIRNLSAYETFTCLAVGSTYDTTAIHIDRTNDGQATYEWKLNTEPLDVDKEKVLLKKGNLKPGENLVQLCDAQSGELIIPHSSSIFWNEYRKKWVMVFQQVYGTSFLGEVWYAEGDTPVGPWVYARKIVSHNNYSFYNVGQHPLLDQANGRMIYFEGTYTNSFTDNPLPTPRYNYNQVMYRLDLNDPRLYLPSPVYKLEGNSAKGMYMMRDEIESMDYWEKIQEIPFFALPPERIVDGSIPVYAVKEKGRTRLHVHSQGNQKIENKPLFYALPVNELSSPIVTPLYEFTDQKGYYAYSVKSELEGLIRSDKPVCLVWKNPYSVIALDYKAKPVPLFK